MDYAEQYTHPNWQKRRLEILTRDGFKCRNKHCYNLLNDLPAQLHIHHLYYKEGAKLWEYPDSALITFCKDCHRNEEDTLKSLRYSFFSAVRGMGLNSKEICDLEWAFTNNSEDFDRSAMFSHIVWMLSFMSFEQMVEIFLLSNEIQSPTNGAS